MTNPAATSGTGTMRHSVRLLTPDTNMKQLLILGAGTAGTMMANHLNKAADLAQWKITIVDQYPTHYYQPGFLFLPFGLYSEADVAKPKRKFIPQGVDYLE